MAMYHEVEIRDSKGGLFEYECNIRDRGEAIDFDKFLEEVPDHGWDYLCILGKDELLDGVEDIRGRINNEPDIVGAYVVDQSVAYFGLIKAKEC